MSIASDLQKAQLFQDLPAAEIERIIPAALEMTLGPGEYVYEKDDDDRNFYVIAEGKVELIVRHGSTVSVCGHISAGGHFGEVALLTGKPRSVSVRTITETRLLCFDKEKFEAVLMANPLVHRALDRTLAERLAQSLRGGHDTGITVETVSDYAQVRMTGRPARERPSGYDFPGRIDMSRKIRKQLRRLSDEAGPVLITGETGTGKLLAAKQIHLQSDRKSAPYIELDLRQFDPWVWEGKLFGYERDVFPYSPGRQLGLFEQIDNATVVIYHAEELSKELQKKICNAVKIGGFSTIDGKAEHPFRVSLILITNRDLEALEKGSVFIPELVDLLRGHVCTMPPLREHRGDIPLLVEYYLKLYSAEYGKNITRISPDAMGLLMKYDWPANLTELSNVMHRAVMVSQQEEIISEQILLGLPRTEGKLLYNLLRLPRVRRIMESRLYPELPRVAVSMIFFMGVLTLFLGPQEPEKNFGLTLSWYVGWPLLIASFFFLPRFWCSICALSVPGKLVQEIIQPARRLPAAVTVYSGWIMAMFCLAVFWVEVVWNAYENPWLTGMILLTIICGALLFSVLFQRYSWCRYICPLGALNAVFSMPSILELRANRQMCENQCVDHACYRGTDEVPGCPMFRHPFLVDNNKDCILCGRCIKNCRLRSTQLNLRLAPQELWSIQSPRLADSFLIVSIGTVFFLLAKHREFQDMLYAPPFQNNAAMAGSLIFWGAVAASWSGYSLLCRLQAIFISEDHHKVRGVFGYGLIPLVLGGYMAFYTKMFFQGAWRLVPNFLLLFGIEIAPMEFHFVSPQGLATILHITILGGMLACLYATYKIFSRLKGAKLSLRYLVIPFLFILAIGAAYLAVI